MPTLHVHMDESGDLNFAPKGSRHYVFAASWTYEPAPLANALTDLRYTLLRAGHDLPAFHATSDRQGNRDAVVELLRRHEPWRFAGLIVEKCKVNPVLYEPSRFYPTFASMLFKFVFRGCMARGTDRVLIYTDTLPVKRNREAVEKAIKLACGAELKPKGVQFHVYHHPRESNAWLQVTDYCCWALYRKWERGDARTYALLRARLEAEELNVTARGDQTIYY